MMRICEVSPYPMAEVSGITSLIQELARQFMLRGHALILMSPAPLPPDPPTHFVYWTIQPRGPFRNASLSVQLALRLWRDRSDWDIIHAHQGHPATIAAAVVARALGRQVVTTFHMVPPPSRGLRGWIQETSIRVLKAISSRRVYVSEKTRQEFQGPGLVILNGVDIENVRASLGQRDALRRELGLSGCVIAFAGRKARIKGYWDLIRALHSARQSGADVRLLSTGSFPDDESQECERLIQDLGLGAFL